MESQIAFVDCSFAMEEILFDAQTSGGLLVSMPPEDGAAALEELKKLGLPCNIVGQVTARKEKTVIVRG